MERLKQFILESTIVCPKRSNVIFDIMECELYVDGDPFKHMNERQKEANTFYVHRTGKMKASGYKGGTYKGIDYVLSPTMSILIRSIRPTIPNGPIIEGPCKSVEYLCHTYNLSLLELEDMLEIGKHAYIDPTIVNSVIYGSRVGLTLKRCPSLPASIDAISDITKLWMQYLVAPLRIAKYTPLKHRETFYIGSVVKMTSYSFLTGRIISKIQNEISIGKTLTMVTPDLSSTKIASILGIMS